MIELLPRLAMLAFPVGNAYLWHDPAGLTLIDTGVPGSARAIAEAIEELGYQRSDVRRILLTHFHVDHVGSAAEIAGWSGADVYAHRAEAPVIRGAAAGPPPQLTEWERQMFEGLPTFDPPDPVAVSHELDDGDAVDLGGGVHALTVAVPGHTPGSAAYYLPQARVLFAGDSIARTQDGRVILGVFNADPARAAASFRRQARLDAEVACFGHGAPVVEDAAEQLRAATRQLPE